MEQNSPMQTIQEAALDEVAKAIKEAWGKFGEVPFPLYDHEARQLAQAAWDRIRELDS